MRISFLVTGISLVAIAILSWFVMGMDSAKNTPRTGLDGTVMLFMCFAFPVIGVALLISGSKGGSVHESELNQRTIYARLAEVSYDRQHYAVLANLGNGKVELYEVSGPLPKSDFVQRDYPTDGGDKPVFIARK